MTKTKTLWREDVIEAFKHVRPFKFVEDVEVEAFLKEIEIAYNNRWERDPECGEGAVEWITKLFKREGGL